MHKIPDPIPNVRIYEDYFVSLKPPQGPITFTKFDFLTVKPSTHIPVLKRGEKLPFKLEFPDVNKRMSEFFNNSEIKGQRMKIVRLIIRYRRSEDSKEYKNSKAYVVAGSGNYLVDYDERGISLPGGPSFSEIKQVLGVS